MDLIELGGARLHVLTAWPGLPGEADRVARAVAQLDPAIVLADLDTAAALRLREQGAAFASARVDAVFAREVARRYAPETRGTIENPFVAVARVARNKKMTLMPLRPSAKEPGFFARRGLAKRAAAIPETPQEKFGAAFAQAVRERKHFDAAADADAAQPRLAQALAEGRAPVLAILQAHRADAFLALVRAAQKVSA